MPSRSIVFYLHAHQPYRLRHYSIFDCGSAHNYFDTNSESSYDNRRVLEKVAAKSYRPTNEILLRLVNKYPEFKVNLSITGVLIEQLEMWAPDVLDSFKELAATGRLEIATETYYHSLAFFYDKEEFTRQVEKQTQKIKDTFGLQPSVLRNTELAYNNELGAWADEAGFRAVLAEGWDPVLGWRSPNFMYRPVGAQHAKLLLKNYRLSDDVAFRFGDQDWKEWPLTADKYTHWLSETGNADFFNLFMDYETFGEHQWEDKGIFEFLNHFPGAWLQNSDHGFLTFSEAIDRFPAVDEVDMPQTVTWADTERDLTAWLGNPMQQQSAQSIYSLSKRILDSGDGQLIEDWRRLQISDHLYYMCTKWFADGDVHAYFSPYDSPYDALINYMNTFQDLRFRLAEKGLL